MMQDNMMSGVVFRSCRPLALVAFAVFAAALQSSAFSATSPAEYAVQVSASVSKSPPQITLSWPSASASSYKIYRKSFGSTSWGSVIASLSGSATSWTDTSVSVGGAYEYQIVKSATVTGYGYIFAGIERPMTDGRGKLSLIVESTYAGDLAAELTRLQQDLVGDGWTVIRHDVSRSASVSTVKNLIKGDAPVAAFLFGRVPVPYSGNLNPDGHTDHKGAWPADVYYGDTNGSWTDSSVTSSGTSRTQNQNRPGDGKFDQSTLPSDVDVIIGRVDLYDMGTMGAEKDLLRRYLNKDHAYRHGQYNVARRGVVDDNFGDYQGQAFASNGWRNFAPMFGASNVSAGEFVTSSSSALWGYGTGGGNYTSASGVASTSTFASNSSLTVFTMLFGSYFGDWDSTNNFLRAPLGGPGYGLTCSWSARPYWFYHHMGLGETVGYGAKLSQNNSGHYYTISHSVRGVHMALMGDPTLRLHAVRPPSGLSVSSGTVRWTASPDSNIVGYHVYRGSSAMGPFTRLTSSPVSGTSYTDSTSGTYTYMVRAVKLESGGSGTYFNPSQGIFSTGSGGSGGTPPPAISDLTAKGGDRLVNVSWSASSGATSYNVKRSTTSGSGYTTIATVTSTNYSNTGLTNGTTYYYVVTAQNSYGVSGNSNQASATPAAVVTGTLPSPWQDMDIGSCGIAGSAGHASGVFTIKGSGADIWDGNDAFHFVYQPLNGDGQIVARVTSLGNTNPWAKAGVMIRETLSANSKHAMVVSSVANGIAFQRKTSTGGAGIHTAGVNSAAPYWVKLVRAGSTFTAYQSSNGSTWSTIGSENISMAASVFIGMPVTAHNNSALCTAVLDNVSVSTGGGGTVPPPPPPPTDGAIALPAKIQAEDYLPGDGVGFYDTTSGNTGGKYRTDRVDIATTTDVGGGYYVGWTAAGEWTAYSVSSAASASYNITLRVATTYTGKTAHLELDGRNVSGTMTIPNTGGWENWAYVTASNVSVSAGAHTLKLVHDTGAISVNYINVTDAAVAASKSMLASMTVTPNPATVEETVTFSIAAPAPVEARDAEGEGESDPIAIVWDFGDGTGSVGENSQHVYTAPGTYNVRVTVGDSSGNSQTQSADVTVGANGAAAEPMTLRTFNAGVKFSETGRDAVRMEAKLPLAEKMAAGTPVTIDIGGALISATLDAKGRAKVRHGSVRLTPSRREDGTATLNVNVSRLDLAGALTDEGVQNANANGTPLKVTIRVTIGSNKYIADFNGAYSAKEGKQAKIR